MKKIFSFILIFLFTLPLCSCFESKNLFELITEEYADLGWECTSMKDDKIEMQADIVTKSFDDSLLVKIVYYDKSTLHIFLTADYIDYNYDNLNAIENFNAGNSFLKAYVTTNGFLKFHFYDYDTKNAKEALDSVIDVLDTYIFENDFIELTKLTYTK